MLCLKLKLGQTFTVDGHATIKVAGIGSRVSLVFDLPPQTTVIRGDAKKRVPRHIADDMSDVISSGQYAITQD